MTETPIHVMLSEAHDEGYEKGVRDAFEIVDVILSEKAENWGLLYDVTMRISKELEVEVAAS